MNTILWTTLYIIVVVQVSNLCTTIYLHRSLTHRALTLKGPVAVLMRLWLWLHTGINPREWAAVHRKHHHFTDQEGDPHSPKLEGLWKVVLANVYYYRKEAANPETIKKYTKDIRRDWLEALTDYGNVGMLLGGLGAVMLLGPVAGLIGFGLQMGIYVILNGLINGVCHMLGYRNFDNEATNLRWVAWITAGEGLHNNHHHAPSSPKLSYRKSEVDPAWIVIQLLRLFRLAELRTPARQRG